MPLTNEPGETGARGACDLASGQTPVVTISPDAWASSTEAEREDLHALIRELQIPASEKERLLAMTPASYIGKAAELAKRA